MHSHEKKAFFKFFYIYFISVSLLILTAGYFYFEQTKEHLLKSEEFSIIEYARHIKMHENLDEFSNEYKYEILDLKIEHIHIKNFRVSKNYFIKLLPIKFNHGYMKLYKSKKSFDTKLFDLKVKIWFVQLLLLIIFGFISYRLAKNALKPLQESISTLDKFAKDLIHDLNTPVTSIKLNLKLLAKVDTMQDNSAFKRLQKSVHTISELHENLTVLLQEETFQMDTIDICRVVDDVIQIQKQIFPNISFHVTCSHFKVKTNENAIKQVLQNLISNGCKYNSINGSLSVYTRNNVLYIQDTGKGIQEPQKIFERSYSGENSSGIGLDIVKRITTNMNIEVKVSSSESGSTFVLVFE